MLTRRRPLLEGYAHALRPLSASQLVAFVVLASFFSLCQAACFLLLCLICSRPCAWCTSSPTALGVTNPILAKVHDAGRYHHTCYQSFPIRLDVAGSGCASSNLVTKTHLAAGAPRWLKLWPPICCTPGSTS